MLGKKGVDRMATKGIDCATPLNQSTANTLAKEGMAFTGRYVVPEGYAKRLTLPEADAISQAGMKIVTVYETTATRASGGAASGSADGDAAFREAKKLGQPPGTAVYFAVDYNAQPKDYDAIEQYLLAAGKKLSGYEVGVYGSFAVVEEMAKRGACKRFWQTYAWSNGKVSSRANIYQYKNDQKLAGITVDYNESYGGEGWWSTVAANQPNPDNPTVPKDAAQKVIDVLGALYMASADADVRAAAHFAADALRDAAGILKNPG